MKKFIIITTLALSTLLSSVTVFADSILPGKPSLLNHKYAESLSELSADQRKDLLLYDTYQVEGEKTRHPITAYNGEVGKLRYSSEIIRRAEFSFKAPDNETALKLSSDGTVNVRILGLKRYNYLAEEHFESFNYIDLLCLYGDKAEQWFGGCDDSFLPPDKLTTPGFRDYSFNPSSDNERGCSLYWPIVCVREDYIDNFYLDDFSDLKLYVYYSDEDWLKPEKLELNWEGMSCTLDIDSDIKATSNFKASLVTTHAIGKAAQDERKKKYNELYGSIEENDPFSDKKNSSKDKNKDKDKKTSDNEPTWRIPLPTEEPDKKDDVAKSDEKPSESSAPTKEPTEIPAPTEKTSETPSETPAPTEKPSEPTIPSAEPTTPPPADTDGTQTAVYLNGQLLKFSESPVTFNDRVLVPMRKIFEALDADVDWNQDNMSVSAQKDGTLINMQIGSTLFQKDDSKITLDAAPILVNDTTMVPIRAIAEAFGANVVWNSVDKSVIIETK